MTDSILKEYCPFLQIRHIIDRLLYNLLELAQLNVDYMNGIRQQFIVLIMPQGEGIDVLRPLREHRIGAECHLIRPGQPVVSPHTFGWLRGVEMSDGITADGGGYPAAVR